MATIDQHLFTNMVRSLFNIDGHLLPELETEHQREFVRDPVRYFMSTDAAQQGAIFREVMKRQARVVSLPSETSQDIAEMVERLRNMARASSEAMRTIAQAKSLRQDDNPERRIDLYTWPAWEETTEWKAADMIEQLATTA